VLAKTSFKFELDNVQLLRSNNAIFVVDCWSSGITLSNGFNQTITFPNSKFIISAKIMNLNGIRAIDGINFIKKSDILRTEASEVWKLGDEGGTPKNSSNFQSEPLLKVVKLNTFETSKISVVKLSISDRPRI
jgi:hypothetical protein